MIDTVSVKKCILLKSSNALSFWFCIFFLSTSGISQSDSLVINTVTPDSVMVYYIESNRLSRLVTIESVKRRHLATISIPSYSHIMLRMFAKIPMDSNLLMNTPLRPSSSVVIELFRDGMSYALIGISDSKRYHINGNVYKKNREMNRILKAVLPRWKWLAM